MLRLRVLLQVTTIRLIRFIIQIIRRVSKYSRCGTQNMIWVVPKPISISFVDVKKNCSRRLGAKFHFGFQLLNRHVKYKMTSPCKYWRRFVVMIVEEQTAGYRIWNASGDTIFGRFYYGFVNWRCLGVIIRRLPFTIS